MMECDVDSDYALTNGSPIDGEGDIDPIDFLAVADKCERNAPGEDKWYHGMVDRTKAELFLSPEPWGTYLVRISPHHTSKYTLSVKTEGSVKHFMIDTLYGEYYISIHKFPSLGSIIGYYTEVSPLLAGLYLKKPYTPTKAVSREKRLKAKASYKGEDDEQLSFKVGEKFLTNEILDCEERSCWIKVRKEDTDETGYALRVLMVQVPHDDELYDVDGFHGDIPDEEVISTLLKEEVGAYMLNNRENSSDYTMHVRTSSDVNTSIIYQEGAGYKHNGQTYCSLNEMVNGYRSNDFKLYPVPRKNRSKIHSNNTKCQRERRASCQVPLVRDHTGASANILQTKNKRTKELQKTKVSIKIVNDRSETRAHLICNKKIEANISCADSKIYHVANSVFNIPNPVYCIVVTGTNGEHKSYYLEALSQETHDMFKKWCCSESSNRRRVQLDLRVSQFKFPQQREQNGSFYCDIGFDGSITYRTEEKESSNSGIVAWGNELYKCDTHNVAQSQNLTVSLNHNKGSSRRVVGECSIKLSELKQLDHLSQWYTLYHNKEKVGEVQLQHYYTDLCIGASESYQLQSILEALRADSYSSMKGIGYIVRNKPQDSRDTLSAALLNACGNERVSLVKQVVANEIEQHPIDEPHLLLRGTSFATLLFKNLCRIKACRNYVHDILEVVANDLAACCYQFDTDDREAVRWLQSRAEKVLRDICESAPDCPLEVRKILSHILQCSRARWPCDDNMKTHPVKTVIFLRMLCAGFTSPQEFGLKVDNRVLCGMKKIGKSLLKICGNAKPGCNQPCDSNLSNKIPELNLSQNLPLIEHFIQCLVDYKDTIHEDSQEPHDHDSAHFTHLLLSNLPEIKAQSLNDVSLQPLVIVLDKLKNE